MCIFSGNVTLNRFSEEVALTPALERYLKSGRRYISTCIMTLANFSNVHDYDAMVSSRFGTGLPQERQSTCKRNHISALATELRSTWGFYLPSPRAWRSHSRLLRSWLWTSQAVGSIEYELLLLCFRTTWK